jgi:pimeloyl-ACP methyl ester carboxylesterase
MTNIRLGNIQMKALLLTLILFSLSAHSMNASHFVSEEFSLYSQKNEKLSGIISRPLNKKAQSIVIITHSYGPTNVVAGDQFKKFRSEFTARGISVVVWDKPGCGESEGEFDINQPVQSSAEEIIAAIKVLRETNEPGAEQIGLYGGSRAGWIAPLAIDQEGSNIKFWISVSGTDPYENWDYLIRSSLEIAGYSSAEVQTVTKSLSNGNLLFASGATYEEYLEASEAYKQDKIVQKITGNEYIKHETDSVEYKEDKKRYYENQQKWISNGRIFDKEAGLTVVIEDFESMLKSFSIPVFAIFGDKDKNVDWRKTKALYERAFGANLTVKVFENADHALRLSKTGGFLESQQKEYRNYPQVEGYYDVMLEWVCSKEFCY